jgi:SAM-dependent methyltransferase
MEVKTKERLTKEAVWLLKILGRENPVVKEFVLRSFQGLPTSLEAEEETWKYFAANSAISTAVLTSPGSSMVTEILYERRHSHSYIDEYFLRSKAGKAVAARLKTVKKILSDILTQYQNDGVTIANLGSGPGRDVIDVLATHRYNELKVKAVNIDIDEMALKRGQKLARIKKVEHLVKFIRANFLHYARRYSQEYDIVLLVGVLCPLDTVTCTLYLQLIRNLLKPNGYLIASNVSTKMMEEDPFTYHLMARIGNWEMKFKTPEELRKIFQEAGYKWKKWVTDKYGFHIIGIGQV